MLSGLVVAYVYQRINSSDFFTEARIETQEK